MTALPLSGVRILAFTQLGAGPYAMMLLGDLGAEIIKIEDPTSGGDEARRVSPYANAQGKGDIAQLIQRVNDALNGCPSPPTPSVTVPAINSPTATVTLTSTPANIPTMTPTQPGGHFVDNGDGTITDTQRGLIWEKKDQGGGLHDTNTSYRWAGLCGDGFVYRQPDAAAATTRNATTGGATGYAQCPGTATRNTSGDITIWDWLNQVNAASFAGHSDWRVPTVGRHGAVGDDR